MILDSFAASGTGLLTIVEGRTNSQGYQGIQ